MKNFNIFVLVAFIIIIVISCPNELQDEVYGYFSFKQIGRAITITN